MFNRSQFTTKYFLTGFHGLKALYRWLIFPFCSTYLVILVGNSLILAVMKKGPSLHQPRYLFPATLALVNLMPVSTLLTLLGIFLFRASNIHFEACLLHMLSIHPFSIMDLGVLLTLPVDCFTAIYNPLRYTAILMLGHIAATGVSCPSVDIMSSPIPIVFTQI